MSAPLINLNNQGGKFDGKESYKTSFFEDNKSLLNETNPVTMSHLSFKESDTVKSPKLRSKAVSIIYTIEEQIKAEHETKNKQADKIIRSKSKPKVFDRLYENYKPKKDV